MGIESLYYYIVLLTLYHISSLNDMRNACIQNINTAVLRSGDLVFVRCLVCLCSSALIIAE